MPAKRKLEQFDPNKSDPEDNDFDPTEARPRKSAKKARTKNSSGSAPKRSKYRGSDVSDDDASSIEEDSFSEPEEEEEEEDFEMNPATGRAVRKAAKKEVNYEEGSGSDPDEFVADDENAKRKAKSKSKRKRSPTASDDDEIRTPLNKKLPKLILKLNVGTPSLARITRAGSNARSRTGRSMEPTSAGLAPKRKTRNSKTTDDDDDEMVALSTSGNHAIRASRSPERIRPSRGSKGVKKPAATIQEETHETSSYEQGEGDAEDADEPEEVAGTDEHDEELDDAPLIQSDLPLEEGDEPTATAQPDEEVAAVEEDDDSDDQPIKPAGRRGTRASVVDMAAEESAAEESAAEEPVAEPRRTRHSRAASKKLGNKTGVEASSDFEPPSGDDDEEISASDTGRKSNDDGNESSPRRGRGASGPKSKSTSRRRAQESEDEELELDPDELAEELHELKPDRRSRPRRRDPEIVYVAPGSRVRKPVDYTIKPMHEIYAADDAGEDLVAMPTRGGGRGRARVNQPWERNLATTYGPFGGGIGPSAVLGGPWGTGAAGGADSDSSDDENMHHPSHVGGNVGMTPTSAFPPGLLPGLGQTNPDAAAALSGTPANLGKIKSQKALADADPLGVDQNVDFSKVGGLEGHIDQLKEMVQMPLLYPELFLKFHVTPPRGVLFHGPPGTGKTLLARALAASIGSDGQKITFYMRKGADALSKWVGEAERQLRLLFEEARKTQPSIIFFDEIDGLAPVRSSKQEQIHASIVSTLLALMDGMDGRGQVIVIGATNRPDNIDPALRRPGRFDREFYFPLPDLEARKSILNIHTKDWGIDDSFKASLAHVTKGYGGADLRALCTEAALNSIQRTYPQIYSSNKKLIVDSDKIKVTAKDFMLSVKKIIPSSERSTASGAAPLPKLVEPLLREQLLALTSIVDKLIPIKKKTTALQEAMYEQYEDVDGGFGRETLYQDFEKSRVFRPRLLICGEPGMGQAYLGGGMLNHFEGLHVQSFDLPTMYSDSGRTAEAAIVQLFAEVKRHKPSVIYLPGIDTWYSTLPENVISTFLGMLQAIPPTDSVLVLGITDKPLEELDKGMVHKLFGFSKKNCYAIPRPSRHVREEFFQNIITYVKTSPTDFPEPMDRKKRKLEVLKEAPIPPPPPPTKEQLKVIKQRDHQTLNHLKIRIQPCMDQIQKKYRKFRQPVIPRSEIQYLFDEADPAYVSPDVETRPYVKHIGKDGVEGLLQTATGKFFWNLDTTTIEERLSNGYYCRFKDFVYDIETIAKDSKHTEDTDRILKAKEMLANVEVDCGAWEMDPIFADCENIYRRQVQRTAEKNKKAQARKQAAEKSALGASAQAGSSGSNATGGPVTLGLAIPGTPPPSSNGLSNGVNAHTGNGNSIPSNGNGDDVEMGGTEEMLPPNQQSSRMTQNTSNLSGYAQMSQRSGFQEIPSDASPGAIANDASTTTSGKKTSEGSRWSTQATNGIPSSRLDSSPVEKPVGDSQLPDTQEVATQASSSQEPWVHSQAQGLATGQLAYPSQTPSSGNSYSQNPAIPPFHAPASLTASRPPNHMTNILNDSPVEPTSSQSQTLSQKHLVIPEDDYFRNLLETLAGLSSGCSVEQLEQINRELMEKLWEMRGEWNRTKVAVKMIDVFNETIHDIEEMQRILEASQKNQ